MKALISPADAAETNRPPQVSFVFPEPGERLLNLNTKIKAEASDPDGSVSEVRFYINELLVGTVTNAPYNILADVRTPSRNFKAMARDDQGAETETEVIRVVVSETPVASIMTLEPRSGTLIAAGTDLELKADVVARDSRQLPNRALFYFNGQIVGSVEAGRINATNPPVTFTLTNVAEGEHVIAVRNEYAECTCPTHVIRAVNLAIRDPVLTAGNRLEFEVITAFPGRPTVIEYSNDFGGWKELETVVPATNYFRFVSPVDPKTERRWYRVSLRAQE